MFRISAVEQRVREAQIVGLRSAIDIIRSARDHHDPTDPISTELDEIIHDVEMVIQRELERTWR